MEQQNKLEVIRASFPHLSDGIIYANHAAVSPYCLPVQRAIQAYIQERGSSNIENYPELLDVMENTLQLIGALIHAPAEHIEFAPNTSYGINVLAQGLSWNRGDRIIIPSCEFPANVKPFLDLRNQGVEIDFVSHNQGTFTVDDIEKLVTPRTRLVTVSWVQFLSGFRSDIVQIGALCKDRGILFSVDAIQGLGALTLDVEKAHIDFLATGGHKWLLATQGIGFVYVSGKLLDQLSPLIGWLNGPVDWENLLDYSTELHDDASKFRLGTLNGIGITALQASMQFYRDNGPEWCEENVLSTTAYLREGLTNLGFEQYGSPDVQFASGISTFAHPEAEMIFEKLKEKKIYASLRNKKIRFSPGYYASKEDIDRITFEISRALRI